MIIKLILLSVSLLILFSGMACNSQSKTTNISSSPAAATGVNSPVSALKIDQPILSKEEVIERARLFSPECRIKVGVSMITSGGACGCTSENMIYEAEPPVINVEYTGKGIWIVNKTCGLNRVWNGKWYFYEGTGNFEKRQD
jgi:hypothetical protein